MVPDERRTRRAGRKPSAAAGELGRYAGLGFTLAITLVVFAYVGWWLDERLGTRPWLLVGGVFAGALGGTISLIRKVPPARGGRRGPGPDDGDAGGDAEQH